MGLSPSSSANCLCMHEPRLFRFSEVALSNRDFSVQIFRKLKCFVFFSKYSRLLAFIGKLRRWSNCGHSAVVCCCLFGDLNKAVKITIDKCLLTVMWRIKFIIKWLGLSPRFDCLAECLLPEWQLSVILVYWSFFFDSTFNFVSYIHAAGLLAQKCLVIPFFGHDTRKLRIFRDTQKIFCLKNPNNFEGGRRFFALKTLANFSIFVENLAIHPDFSGDRQVEKHWVRDYRLRVFLFKLWSRLHFFAFT